MVNPTGYTALDLVGYTDKGTYSNSANYVANDLVHYGGNIWRCKVDDTTGVAPVEGADWTLFIGEPTNMAERMIAPLEVSPSLNAYAVGAQLIYNDTLYEVISAISVGDTLTVDSNIQLAPKVSSQIQTLTNETATINNVLGAKNLLPNNAVTQTINGVTFTVNSDGSITVNGTASALIQVVLGPSVKLRGAYKLTGCPLGGDLTTYELRLVIGADHGSDRGGGIVLNLEDQDVFGVIMIRAGVTVSNLVFKPMLRPASIADDTYVPYAKTNRELTEQITNIGTILEANGSVHPTASSGYFDICSLTLPQGTWAITCISFTTFNGNQSYTNCLNYNNANYVVRGNTVDGGGNANTAYVKFEAPTVVTAKGYATSEFAASPSRAQSSRIQAIRIA